MCSLSRYAISFWLNPRSQDVKVKDPKSPKRWGRPRKQPLAALPIEEVAKEPPTPMLPANPLNLKICPKGQWNERMIIETVFSLFTVILKRKKLTHRLMAPLQARLAYTCAVFNICTAWDGNVKLQIAPFAL